jgi:hypothetical protein
MRTISKLTVMAILGVSLVACGGGAGAGGPLTATNACKELAVEVCAKMHQCLPKEALAADPDTYGKDAADCAKKFQATECTPDKITCESGTTYSASDAESCIDGIPMTTCDNFVAGTLPASCDKVCK